MAPEPTMPVENYGTPNHLAAPEDELTLQLGPFTIDLRRMTLLDQMKIEEAQKTGDRMKMFAAFRDMVVKIAQKQDPHLQPVDVLDAIELGHLEQFGQAMDGNPTVTAPTLGVPLTRTE